MGRYPSQSADWMLLDPLPSAIMKEQRCIFFCKFWAQSVRLFRRRSAKTSRSVSCTITLCRAHSSAAQTGICHLPSIFLIHAAQSINPNYFIHHQKHVKYLQSAGSRKCIFVWFLKETEAGVPERTVLALLHVRCHAEHTQQTSKGFNSPGGMKQRQLIKSDNIDGRS